MDTQKSTDNKTAAEQLSQGGSVNKNDHGYIENVPLSNNRKIPVLYGNHFLDRLTKPDEKEGDRRRLPTGTIRPMSAIQKHISKIHNYIDKNGLATGNEEKKFCFIDKYTKHKIVTKVSKHGILHDTYFGHNHPVDNFEKAHLINPRHKSGKIVTLENIIHTLIQEKIEKNQIVTVWLD